MGKKTIETEALVKLTRLLAEIKPHLSPHVLDLRLKALGSIVNYDYINASDMQKTVFRTLTEVNQAGSALDVADVMLGWSIVFPQYADLIINSCMFRQMESYPNAEGFVLGCFEAVSQSGAGENADESLFEFLESGFQRQHWKSGACLITSAVSGRLSQAMSSFISPVWVDNPRMSERRIKLSYLLKNRSLSDIEEVVSGNRKTLHGLLIDELSAKLFLAAPASRKVDIFRYGLPTTI